MVDESAITAATPATTADAKRLQVSKREVLDAAGAPQDEWIGGEGFSYTSLTENFTIKVMKKDLPATSWDALAVFGGLTLAGNTTNTVRNGKSKGDQTELMLR